MKEEHKSWLARQEKETADWHQERSELDDKIEDLNRRVADLKKRHSERETELTNENN